MTDKVQTICPGEKQTTLVCSANHVFLELSVSALRESQTRSLSYSDIGVGTRGAPGERAPQPAG